MALKVFDLQCENQHVFEGWFNSSQGYEDQKQRGLLNCPICSSQQIEKKLSAPRLNLRHGRDGDSSTVSLTAVADSADSAIPAEPTNMAELQAAVFNHIKQVIKNTDDVGEDFASEARKIHEGDAPERAIRGSATQEEYQELQDEGITVIAIPDILDDTKLN